MDARTVFAWALVAVSVAILWVLVQPFLSWLLVTGLLAFVLTPVHRRLEDRVGTRISAGVLALLVVVVIIGSLILSVTVILEQASTLLENVSRSQVLGQVNQVLEQRFGMTVPIRPLAQRATDRITAYASGSVSSVVSVGFHSFLGFLLLVFVLYYLLKDGDRAVEWVRRITPLPPGVNDELIAATNRMTWAILKGHVLVAFIQGAVAGVALFVTGVPEAAILTVAMMVLALVPIVGVAPILGGAVLYLLFNGRALSAAFVVIWGLTSVAVTDDYLRAVLIDRGSELHSAVIFVGILGGTYLLGPVGLFIGPLLIGFALTAIEVLGDYYGVIHRPVR
ncbi:AI-2E family transporter [Natrinema sp. 74]|uniref:AI-2E family transporter n=1 Tax=Natrinema sp. 74 TaxID=3384159 RepID=UPI0038D3E0CE